MINDLLPFWPSEADVAACLKTDAEAASEAVSLAVHQPMRLEVRVIGSETAAARQECDEHALLRAFLNENLPEGRVILPIVGTAGVGKSHVVRWLHAQITRMPGAERRVVIRIPKNTSLRGVLELLLDKVQGAAYEHHRRELARAQQELDPDQAAGLLCEMLAQALESMREQARAQLRDRPNDTAAREIADYCDRDMLPSLLRNGRLRDEHFVRSVRGGHGVVRRLVEQLTEARPAGAEDDRQHLLTPEDLVFDGVDLRALGRGEARAVAQLERPERRVTAARILNTALDDAKQRLLHLDPTVADLFDAVRSDLLREKKELVLLVEDFAVLSGLQKQLLQVMIKEAVRDGKPVLCTMRTALAYTTGYPVPETVLTRAHIEYRIPDEPGTEAEILARVDRLVGAYLNAARLGQAEIERVYRERPGPDADLRSWIPRFDSSVEPEAREALLAFGASEDGYALFPLNRAAIHELAREGCRQGDRFVYNPRFVLQNVINKVLVHRDMFLRAAFPPPAFGGGQPRLQAGVVRDVTQRTPPALLDRYLRFLGYWGGMPATLADITNIHPKLFEAFGLDRSQLTNLPFQTKARDEAPASVRGIDRKPSTRPPPLVDPEEDRWTRVLEAWRQGEELSQVHSNALRKLIAEALDGAVDPGWDLFRTRQAGGIGSWHEAIFVPRGKGNEGRVAEDSMAAVCTEQDLQDPARSAQMHGALMAVVRFQVVHRGSWAYDGADDDMPRYSAYVDGLAVRAREYVRRRYFRADWDPMPVLVQALLIGARALGLAGADKDTDAAALLNAIFAPAPDAATLDAALPARQEEDPTGWTMFAEALAKCRRPSDAGRQDKTSFTAHLLNLVGARQGGADTVHALDLLRLKPLVEAARSSWEISAPLPRSKTTGVPEFPAFEATFGELKQQGAAVARAQKWLTLWHAELVEWLGCDLDKEALVRALKETVDAARAARLTGDVDVKRLNQTIEAFRIARVVPAVDDAAKLEGTPTRGLVLSILGRGHWRTVRLAEELMMQYDRFLEAVENELKGAAERLGADPLAEASADLRAEFEAMGETLTAMGMRT